ncbi:MAG: hypothetical protein ACRBEE_09930 [Arenicella sp.]
MKKYYKFNNNKPDEFFLNRLFGKYMGERPESNVGCPIIRHQVSWINIRRSEAKFLAFVFFCFLFAFIVFTSILMTGYSEFLKQFWKGNILWGIGSMFVMFSVLHGRFYDIESNARKLEINGATKVLREDKKSFALVAEHFFKHVWIVGFLLVGTSRWVIV